MSSILGKDPSAKILICSLTKTAAREIASRNTQLPDFRVGTLHSHAFKLLQDPQVVDRRIEDWNERHPHLSLSLKKMSPDESMVTESGKNKGLADEKYAEYQRLRALMLPPETWPLTIQSFHELWVAWKKETTTIDFTDMIELALTEFDKPPFETDIVIADECQDLSTLEMALLAKWGKAAGVLMLAGDPWQALFTWRGADPSIFTQKSAKIQRRSDLPPVEFPEPYDDSRIRVLSKSYRLPKAVHRAAMKWAEQLSDYRELDFKPRDEEGRVSQFPAQWKAPTTLVREVRRLFEETEKTVMIQMSCSYMLQPLIVELRAAGLPFANPWRPANGSWNPLGFGRKQSPRLRLLDFLRIDSDVWDEHAGMWRWGELASWIEVMKSKECLTRGAKKLTKLMVKENHENEIVEPEEVFTEAAWEKLVAAQSTDERLDWFEDNILSTQKPKMSYPIQIMRRWGPRPLRQNERIFIGTIHSFKGAEADIVYLAPDLSWSFYQQWRNPATKDSVVRMFYVGITRAREELRILQPVNEVSVPLHFV